MFHCFRINESPLGFLYYEFIHHYMFSYICLPKLYNELRRNEVVSYIKKVCGSYKANAWVCLEPEY